MEYHFIINPVAGKTDVSEMLQEQVLTAAQNVGIAQESCHFVTTNHIGHARELAQSIAATGEEMVLFAAGGDGTLNEVFAGARAYKNAAVACLPYGSGNDFLRNYGTREDFLSLEEQLCGGVVDIDLLQIVENVAASICAVGLDARVAYGIPKFRRLPFCGGSMAYNLSIIQQLCGKLGQVLRIRLDDETIEDNFLMVAICNGTCYGGGFMPAPDASLNDGLIDVICVKKMSLLRIAKVIGIYQKGKHLVDGKIIPAFADVISFRRVKAVSVAPANKGEEMIITIDGECAAKKGIDVAMLENSARFFLPKTLFAKQKSQMANV